MNIIGINGSPRKGWNTELMVREALKGAESNGAETEIYNLYDMRFRGCISCFGCKKKDNSLIGKCVFADELLPVLNRIHRCDGLVLGTPMYINEVSSAMRALLERLIFQYIPYEKDKPRYFDRNLPVLAVYTMNAPGGYDEKFAKYAETYNRLLGGPVTTIAVTETLQMNDYGAYEMSRFDVAARKKRREDVFPGELKKAFAWGADLAKKK